MSSHPTFLEWLARNLAKVYTDTYIVMAFVNIQHLGLYYTIKLHDSSEDVQMW